MNEKIVTYEPDNSIKKGFFSIFPEIYFEVKQNRWLTYQLFRRDFAALHKQTHIGFLWIFIIPLINVGIFVMLNRSGILNFGDINAPYPMYALLGMAFWQLFSTVVITGGSAVNSAGDMLTRINFSKKSLVIASMGRPIISFFIQLLLAGILFVVYRTVPNKGTFLIPLVLIPLILFSLGLSFIISILNAAIRDTGNLLSISMTLFMYATPVLYARPKTGILSLITRYNPMYYFISAGRDLILTGKIIELKGFLCTSSLSLIIFTLALLFFHLTETRIAERI
jgi:lipopolysaccharide transport system permease protein